MSDATNDRLESLRASARRAVAASPVPAAVTVSLARGNCTRFAEGRITQNTTNESWGISIALARREGEGHRLLRRHFGDGDPADLLPALLPELAAAPVNGEFKGFAPPLPSAGVATAHPSLERFAPVDAAGRVRRLVDAAPDLVVGGILQTSLEEVATVNGEGVDRRETFTECLCDVKYQNGRGGSASFQWAGRDLDRLPLDALAEAAARRCRADFDRAPLPDGEYSLLLSPSAVSEFLYFLAHLGFGGREFKQKRSFIHDKLGTQVIANDRITVTDDPHHPDTLTANYDDEGMPRRPLVLIERGVARAVAHNTLTAPTLSESTGHAIGTLAYPMLLRMAPGDRPFAEMVRAGEGAVLVSRLHYPTIDNPDRVILKGSTKDGTFLLGRDGALRPLADLEFQVEIPRLFAAMEELSSDLFALPQGSLASSLPGANLVPGARVSAVAVRGGRFTLGG